MNDPLVLTAQRAAQIEHITASGALADTPAVAEFGETLAGKAIGGRPRNWVLGFGHQDLDRLPEILDFYAEDGVEPRFALAPMRFTADVAEAPTSRACGDVRIHRLPEEGHRLI